MNRTEAFAAMPCIPCRDRIADIVLEVASMAGITPASLLGRSRQRRFVEPRQYAIWLARKETGASLPQIGAFFDRDHTTIIHSIRAVEARIHSNEGN